MKVALYLRVSTKKQDVGMQRDSCEKYCEFQKHEIYKTYVDLAESGKKHSRPQLDEMLRDMRKNKFSGVLVYKLDRIGRSLSHLLSLFAEFKSRGISFMSSTQNINTSTPEGRMFMSMMMILAEYERELTVGRVKDGMKRARSQGKQIGRKKTEINRFQVQRLLNQGESYRSIAKKLSVSLGVVQRCIKKEGLKKA